MKPIALFIGVLALGGVATAAVGFFLGGAIWGVIWAAHFHRHDPGQHALFLTLFIVGIIGAVISTICAFGFASEHT